MKFPTGKAAQILADTVLITAGGAQPCSKWTASRKEDYTSWYRTMPDSWVIGFLAGRAVESGVDLLKGTTSEDIYEAINQKCRLRPSQTIGVAASAIVRDLSH